VLELFQAKAPITVRNFLEYLNGGFYAGTIFHRVIPNFMIQGGGFTGGMQPKNTRAPIANEAANGLSNKRGTIAMARTNDPDSATSQFFINLVDNANLDRAYCVFGRVVEGMSVADAIAGVQTGTIGQLSNLPLQPVVITKAALVKGAGKAGL
jgi:peptidyl-prolyl cis-trans isomerase A (cyclophilin A)